MNADSITTDKIDDLQVDDPRKVFVSRVPRTFDGPRLQGVLELALGAGCIESCDILWDVEEDHSRGAAFVVFKEKEMRSTAVKQGSFKVTTGKKNGKKNQIMYVAEVERQREGRGRDGGVCFLWKQGTCTHGESCRFAHTGEGSCVENKASTKKKRCFAFKRGKCKAGDACPFVHEASTSLSSSTSSESSASSESSSAASTDQKPCFNWQKKGKCRKGDACTYKHESKEETAARKNAKTKKDKKSSKKRKRQEMAQKESGHNYAPLTIRVFGLAYTSTEKDVRQFFNKCGTITEFEMPLWEDSGRSKGFCQLKFMSEENVDRAIALDGKELDSRWLRIQRGVMFSSWGVKKGEDSNEAGGTDGVVVGGGGGNSSSSNNKRSSSSMSSGNSSSSSSKKTKDSKTIFLGNLDWTLSKRALRRACDAAYGKVTSVRMQKPDNPVDSTTGTKSNNTGYAHVTFETLEIAEKAVSMNGQELLGRTARVDWA